MKPKSLLLTVPAIAGLAALALPIARAQGPEAGSGGLVNVFPGGAPARQDFDAERFGAALKETDLEQREASYAELLRAARRDPGARAWLEETATGSDLELAWTARLALRELERTRPRSPLDVWSGRNDLDELEHVLEEFMGRFAPGWNARIDPFVIPFPGLAQTPLPSGRLGSRSRSIDVRNDADGWVVRIRETVDGEEDVREYKGKTLEEILDANPELKEEVGISGSLMGPGFSLHIGSPQDSTFDFESLLENFGVRPGFGWRADAHGAEAPIRTDVLGVLARPATDEEGGRGLYVRSTIPRTIAAMLGIVSGDVLLELNGRELVTIDDVTAALQDRDPDGRVEATWRDATGRTRTGTWMP